MVGPCFGPPSLVVVVYLLQVKFLYKTSLNIENYINFVRGLSTNPNTLRLNMKYGGEALMRSNTILLYLNIYNWTNHIRVIHKIP